MAMEWTDELIARLKELWEQGLSTAEIGRQLSITKNAVVGKAHRLGLPPRPSPIRNKSAAESASKPARPRTTRTKKTDAETPSDDVKVEKAKATVEEAAPVKPVEKKASAAKPTKAKAEKVEKPAKVKADTSVAETPAKMAAPRKEAAAPAVDVEEADVPARPAVPQRKVAPPRRVRDTLDRSVRQGPTCQWPIGDPGTPEFHFCGATPLSGKPYCAEHAAIAYVKIRDRRH